MSLGTIVIDNKVGTVRGYADGAALRLIAQADTPKQGPVHVPLHLRGAGQLIYFYSVLLNLEMQFFSLIARRGHPTGFNALADVGAPAKPWETPPEASTTGGAGGGPSPGPDGRRPRPPRTAVTRPAEPNSDLISAWEPRGALFQGELTHFRTTNPRQGTGAEIRCKLDENSGRYRIFFGIRDFEQGGMARFDMNIGEIRALKTMTEQALATLDRLEFQLLDDPNTLTCTLIADIQSRHGAAMTFLVTTPGPKHRPINFSESHNLSSVSFWCERALAYRGNTLIAFKQKGFGMSFWEHKDPPFQPYIRFHLGEEQNELLNLTRLNLCAIKLFSDLTLRRVVCRTPEPAMVDGAPEIPDSGTDGPPMVEDADGASVPAVALSGTR